MIEASEKTELEFKQVSPEELHVIKEKIRNDAKKAAELEITIFGLCILLIAILGGWMFLA